MNRIIIGSIATVCFTGVVAASAHAQCTPAPSGIVAWWKGEADAADTMQTHDGIATHDILYSTGMVGNGFDFSAGSNVRVPYDADFDVNAGGFTAEFWMKGATTGATQTPFDKSHGGGDSLGWAFQGTTTSAFFIGGGGPTNSNFPGVGSSVVFDGTFHHLAGTWDPNDSLIRYYVDGDLQGTAPLATPANNGRDLYIGRWHISGRQFYGIADEVTLYDRALSESEIDAIVAAGSDGKCAPCIPACAAGQECDDGTCVCTATSCPSGCCDGVDQCQTSSIATCGIGGAACADCDDADPCTPDACNSGTCENSGVIEVCGDGATCGGEQCDDGGTMNFDGCSSICEPEPDHHIRYKVKASKQVDKSHKFPKNWNLQLNDALIDDADPDDPENYVVKKEKALLVPARKNDENNPVQPALAYLSYQIKESKEGVGPEDGGKFPKAVKHVKRRWEVTNQFGAIEVDSKKVLGLLVPASADTGAAPAAPGDHDHFLCYQVKPAKVITDQTPGSCDKDAPANAKGACVVEEDCGGTTSVTDYCGKPKFRKDLQAFFIDDQHFDDCANDDDGNTSWPTAAVEGSCLYDIKKVKQLCNPVTKSEVEAPRFTAATIDGSTPLTTTSLLCYQAKLAKKHTSATAAALVGAAVDEKFPKQSKHVKRRKKDGSPVFTQPGNQFPVPLEADTSKTELVCVPSIVTGVAPR